MSREKQKRAFNYACVLITTFGCGALAQIDSMEPFSLLWWVVVLYALASAFFAKYYYNIYIKGGRA